MIKTSNKFNSLAQIKFVEDIDQEAAANHSGGVNVALYSDEGFRGEGRFLDNGTPSLNQYGFNDKISSIKILEGQWEFYQDDNYQGNVIFVGPGNYDRVQPGSNDTISSLRRVG
jgi:Beta/Gamma crystallin